MQAPFTAIFEQFKNGLKQDIRTYMARVIQQIHGLSKQNRIDYSEQVQYNIYRPDITYRQKDSLLLGLIFAHLFDFRLLRMAGIDELAVVVRWPAYTIFTIDGTYYSNDVLEQEVTVHIRLADADLIYYQTRDIYRAVAQTYRLILRAKDTVTNKVVLEQEFSGDSFTYYDERTDRLFCTIPVILFQILYLVLSEPITITQTYSTLDSKQGLLRVTLFPEFFNVVRRDLEPHYEYIKQNLDSLFVDKLVIEPIAQTEVANEQNTLVVSPVFASSIYAHSFYRHFIFRNINAQYTPVITPDNMHIIIDTEHPDYYDQPVLQIEVLHNTLLTKYNAVRLVISFVRTDLSESLVGARPNVLIKTEQVPQWTINYTTTNKQYRTVNIGQFLQVLAQYGFGYQIVPEDILSPTYMILAVNKTN